MRICLNRIPERKLISVLVLGSLGCCTILPHMVGLKATGIYFFTVLEAINLKSRCLHGWFFLDALGRIGLMPVSWLLVVAGNPWHFLAYRCITPSTASLVTWPILLCICV